MAKKMFGSPIDIVNNFVSSEDNKRTDYLKRENSNFVYSLPLLRKNLSNYTEEEYLMTHVLPSELVKAYQEGIVYIHDKQLSSYCQSVSCRDIATRGIPTIAKNMIPSQPTKRLKKLFRHFSNVVVLMSQQVSGAVMLAQMTTVLASYLHYEESNGTQWSEDDIKEEMQSLVWELNMPLRSGSESAFSNCTLEFGKASEEIKDEYVVIGGIYQDYQYKDIPSIYFDRINKAFIDVMAKGTGIGIPFTFPLISVQIDDNFHFDNPMFLYLLDKMYYFNGAYFENFRTAPFNNEYYKKLNPCIQARDPSVSRSLCPLSANTKILYYSERLRKYMSSPIKEVFDYYNKDQRPIKVWQNGEEVSCRINKFEKDNFYTIKLVNGLEVTVTGDHLNITKEGTKSTEELTTNDYLPISRKVIPGHGLTYEDGLVVGVFLGDGSFTGNNRITFSLNEDSKKELKETIKKIAEEKFGVYTSEYICTSSLSQKQSCVNLALTSDYATGLINQFVYGDCANNKSINLLACTESIEFRKGILDGLYQTDGGNSNRIYTSSKEMSESITTLCASMGIPVNITIDSRDGRLSTNDVYIIRFYAPDKIKSQFKDVYVLDENYFWFKIKEIIPCKKNKSVAYCLEVIDQDKEPIFMLSNGIVTHNCRLQISLSTLNGLSSGGIFGSSIGNVGAVQVIDLNMNRLLIEYGHDINLLKEKMTYYLNLIEDGHMAKRKWIEDHKELYPTFFAFNDNLKNYFNVFGDVGYHEGLINIGYKDGINDPAGKALAHELKQHMSDVVNSFIKRDNVACGIEASPRVWGVAA